MLMFLSSCYALGSLPCCTKFNSGLKIDQLNENRLIVMSLYTLGIKNWNGMKHTPSYAIVLIVA